MFKFSGKNKSPILTRHSNIRRDIFGTILFILVVAIGVYILNIAVFRSYSVVGPSMEPTLCGNANDGECAAGQTDHLIINRLPITAAALTGHEYIPDRGNIIVFENPHYRPGLPDQYIVKRVIAFPGERVIINNCKILVYNDTFPDGFDPYLDFSGVNPETCVSGDTNTTVPDGELFVIGDHRNGSFSSDSRGNVIGTVPFNKIIGPVSMRIWPIPDFKFF